MKAAAVAADYNRSVRDGSSKDCKNQCVCSKKCVALGARTSDSSK